MSTEWVDQTDCVAAWQSRAMAALLFPTADSLPQLRSADRLLDAERLILVFNPQWQTNGQIISDFGFGKGRRDAEAYVGLFEDVFFVQRVRIYGDSVSIFRRYPGGWQAPLFLPKSYFPCFSCADRINL